MNKLFFCVLLLSSAALAQTCEINSGLLFNRRPSVGGTGVCDQGPETAASGNVVTYKDTYHNVVTGDDNSVSPGVVFLDKLSDQITATGACYYKPPVIAPRKQPIILEPEVILDCPPESVDTVTRAATTKDFNRFISQIRFTEIQGNPSFKLV